VQQLDVVTAALRRVDLRRVEERLLELASKTAISTALPNVAVRIPGDTAPRKRSVAFVAKRAGAESQPAAPSADLATYADLGRVGESLVFEMMLARWGAAAASDAARARSMLQTIASEYWSLDSAARDELERTLASTPGSWFTEERVRDLLWPSRTLYGDAMGFDVFGLNEAGDDWLCLEVKTTQGPAATQFELTVNEYERAKTEGARYVIARVARIHADPPEVCFWHDVAAMVKHGDLRLTPSSFVVSVGARA
jgi:hypothetical protein